jgi:FkbM family methyltransferase
MEQGANGETLVHIAGSAYRVDPHWFWEQFCSGWEEETFEVIRRFVRPDRPFLDVGSWIGPTALIACAHGAQRVVAVEANPSTVAHLRRTIGYNAGLRGRIEVLNRCIHRDAGVVQFGNADGSDSTSSASSLRGHGFAVEAMCLTTLMEEFTVRDPSLIKIDIEGAEIFLDADFDVLAERSNLVIYLSLHPPFWKQMGDPDALFGALARFDIVDPSGKSISLEDVRARCLSPDAYPQWGTAMGNFFEILLFSGSAG